MKKNKNKTIATIIVIIGALAITGGVIINKFFPTAEKESNIDHQPTKVETCKSIAYDEKNVFLAKRYLTSDEEKKLKYKLITSNDEFYTELSTFEYNDEDLVLDFDKYDYLIYYLYDGNNCVNSKYLTNYTLEANTLNIEFTTSEFNKEVCLNEVVYGYGIAIEKNTFVPNTTRVEVTNKEDPFKDCYK